MSTQLSGPLVTIAICTKSGSPYLNSILAQLARDSKRVKSKICLLIIDSSESFSDQTNISQLLSIYKSTLKITHLRVQTQGISVARNKAIQLTRSPYLCFIDDDIELSSSWLGSLLHQTAKNNPAEIIFGPIYPKVSTVKPTQLLKEILHFSPWVLTINSTDKKWQIPYTANVLIKTSLFKRIGQFNTTFGNTHPKHSHPFGEDPEFFQRASLHRATTHFVSQLKVTHFIKSSRISLSYLAYRYFDDGKNQLLFSVYSKGKGGHFGLREYLWATAAFLLATIQESLKNGWLGSLHYVAECLGWSLMSYALLRNWSYYTRIQRQIKV